MTRCRHCLTKAEPRAGRCPVCGIVSDKKSGELSSVEKMIRARAFGIRLVAMCHLIGAGAGLIMMPYFPSPLPMAILAGVNILIAFGLARYSLLAYRCATAYYFLIGMVNVISIQHGAVHLGGIGLALIALYLVGNKTSKAIFERRAADELP